MITNWWRALHQHLSRELYGTTARFRRHLLTAMLRPVGAGIVAATAFGQALEFTGIVAAIATLFVVPAAAIAIGFPAAVALLAIGTVKPSLVLGGRAALRPVAIAVGGIAILLAWWNGLGGLTFVINPRLDDLSGVTGFFVPLLFYVSLLVAIVATAGFTAIGVFHAELSDYGTIATTGHFRTISAVVFVAAVLVADVIALRIDANPAGLTIGTAVAVIGIGATRLAAAPIDAEVDS